MLGGMLREDRHKVQFAETAKGAMELLDGHPEAFDGACALGYWDLYCWVDWRGRGTIIPIKHTP